MFYCIWLPFWGHWRIPATGPTLLLIWSVWDRTLLLIWSFPDRTRKYVGLVQSMEGEAKAFHRLYQPDIFPCTVRKWPNKRFILSRTLFFTHNSKYSIDFTDRKYFGQYDFISTINLIVNISHLINNNNKFNNKNRIFNRLSSKFLF